MIVESNIDVRYPDVDVAGIVHHSIYVYWLEIARMDFFAACGYPYTYTAEYGVNPVMVDMDIKYLAPVHYPDTVKVLSCAVFCAPKKLKLLYKVTSMDGETLYTKGETFHIWAGPDMRSYDMQENMPGFYEAMSANLENEADFWAE